MRSFVGTTFPLVYFLYPIPTQLDLSPSCGRSFRRGCLLVRCSLPYCWEREKRKRPPGTSPDPSRPNGRSSSNYQDRKLTKLTLQEIVYNLDMEYNIYWSQQRCDLITYITRNCTIYDMSWRTMPYTPWNVLYRHSQYFRTITYDV